MLVQEQVIQSLDLNELDLVKEESKESELASVDEQEETLNEQKDKEDCKETENLDDNVIQSQIQKMKEPVQGQKTGEKTFDRFLDLMEIF